MIKNKDSYNKFVFIGSIILLFAISYLRFTYYINPNFSGEPIWIKIAGIELYYSDLVEYDHINRLDARLSVKIKSIIVFWILFAFNNLLLFKFWRSNKNDLIFMLLTWGGLSLIIIIFMGIHFVLKPEQVFFGLFTKIKNFQLSPLYTGVIFIFAKYFNRIVELE
jgi:hypothetical protein